MSSGSTDLRAQAPRLALLAVAYFAAAELGLALSLRAGWQPFATFWPAAGVLLVVLTWTAFAWWPAYVAAAFAANIAFNLLHGMAVGLGLGLALVSCLEACLGAWLLRRCLGGRVALERINEVLVFAFFAALGSSLVGGLVAAGLLALTSDTPFWEACLTWWVANAVGILAMAPALLTFGGGSAQDRWNGPRVVEGMLLLAGMILIAQAIYGEWAPPALRVPIFILPFLLWAGLRFGPRGGAVALLAVSLIGIGNTSQARGPYASLTSDPHMGLLRAQATLCVVSLCVLILSATIAERLRAEQQRIQLIGKLEQALGEIKTLRGLIPLCAWCKNIRDDQGFWQRLEDYLAAHTGAEFTHGLCPQCLEKQMASVGADGDGA